jgi:hypothetical protein
MLVAVPGSTRASRPATPANVLEADGVRLQGSWLEEPVRRAVHAAARRLAQPSCAAVLTDFRDHEGRPLRDHLRDLDLDAPTYARMVLFYDGSNDSPCRRPRTYAFTVPGSRFVRTCPNLGSLVASAPAEAEAVVIHEILHTLGLEENPPRSEDITAAVVKRCRGRG